MLLTHARFAPFCIILSYFTCALCYGNFHPRTLLPFSGIVSHPTGWNQSRYRATTRESILDTNGYVHGAFATGSQSYIVGCGSSIRKAVSDPLAGYDEVCVLWDKSCTGTEEHASSKFPAWYQDFSGNLCFGGHSCECMVNGRNLSRASSAAFDNVLSFARSPRCRKAAGYLATGTSSPYFPSGNTCCGSCWFAGGMGVRLYYWPESDANKSCLSIIGDATAPQTYDATTRPTYDTALGNSSIVYWGCYTVPGATSELSLTSGYVTTATMTTVGSLTIKQQWYNPWSPIYKCKNEPTGLLVPNTSQPHLNTIHARNFSVLPLTRTEGRKDAEPLTQVVTQDGLTFTSPSVYLNFEWVRVTDSCGLLGTSSSKLVAFHTDELSTYDGYYYNLLDYDVPLQYPLPQSFNLRDLPCPPPAVMSKNWYTPAPGEPYIPRIALPTRLSLLDTLWGSCGMALDLTAFDPPRALTPVAGMAPVITKSPTPSGKPSPNPEPIPPLSGSIASSESPPSPAATPKLDQPEKTRGLTSTAVPFGPKSSGHGFRPEYDGSDTKESPRPPDSIISQHATEDPVADILPSAVFGPRRRSTKAGPSRLAGHPKGTKMLDSGIQSTPFVEGSSVNRPGSIGLDSKVDLQLGTGTQRKPSHSLAPKPLPSIIASPELPASTYKSIKPSTSALSADPQVHSISSSGNDQTSQGSGGHAVEVPHDGELTHGHEQSHLPLRPSIVIDGGTTMAKPFDGSGGLYVTPGGNSVPDPRVTSTAKDEESSLVSSLHVYHLTSESKMPITVGTKVITPISQGFVFHGSTTAEGKDPVTVAGTRISMNDPSHIVIGTTTYKLHSPQKTKVFATALADGASIHSLASGRYVYQGVTLTPGAPPAIISGKQVSLDSSNNLFIPEVTHIRQGASHATQLLATVAGAPVTLLPSAVEVAGTTLNPGDPTMMLSGTPIVFHHTALIVDSHTLSLPTTDAQKLSATVAGEAITAEHGDIVVSGTTIRPGKPGVTLNDKTIYINSKGNPVVDTKTDGDPGLASLIMGGFRSDSRPVTPSATLTSTDLPRNSSVGNVVFQGLGARFRAGIGILIFVIVGSMVWQIIM